jgi:hypothetical protein
VKRLKLSENSIPKIFPRRFFYFFPQLLETFQYENLLLPSAKRLFAYFSQKPIKRELWMISDKCMATIQKYGT